MENIEAKLKNGLLIYKNKVDSTITYNKLSITVVMINNPLIHTLDTTKINSSKIIIICPYYHNLSLSLTIRVDTNQKKYTGKINGEFICTR
jgi:hypothetical protein